MQMYKELINKQTFVNKKDEFFWMHLTSYHETKEQQRQAIYYEEQHVGCNRKSNVKLYLNTHYQIESFLLLSSYIPIKMQQDFTNKKFSTKY